MTNYFTIAFAKIGYNYQTDELAYSNVSELHTYNSVDAFRNAWYNFLETHEGAWYWVLHNGKLIISGALDPTDEERLIENISGFYKE